MSSKQQHIVLFLLLILCTVHSYSPSRLAYSNKQSINIIRPSSRQWLNDSRRSTDTIGDTKAKPTLESEMQLDSHLSDGEKGAVLRKKSGITLEQQQFQLSTTDPDDEGPKSAMKKFLEGYNLSPEILAIWCIYFVQGALGVSRLAVTYFLKDTLHLSPSEAAALQGLVTLPWIIKPLYGFLSDGFPIFGYKRRSYLILAGIIGCLSWVAMGFIVHDSTTALLFTLLGSASVAVSDVVADSIVVEKSRSSEDAVTGNTEKAGDLQSQCWGAAAVGGILSAYFSGSLLTVITPQTIFLITAFFPLLISASSILIEEKRDTSSAPNTYSAILSKIGNQSKQIFTTFKNPAIYLPVVFIFFFQATPSPDSAMFYFSTNELGFTPEFLGRVRLVSSIASLVGVVVYRNYLRKLAIKDVIFWASLISTPLGLSQLLLTTHYNRVLGIPDQVFVLTDSVVLTVLGQIAFMPILALAAAICPPGVEGTLFASLMSIYNAAGILSAEGGAALTSYLKVTDSNFDNLSLLLTICTLSNLLPLPFIGKMLGPLGNIYEEPVSDSSNESSSSDKESGTESRVPDALEDQPLL
jgi:folate/biopterin transporter